MIQNDIISVKSFVNPRKPPIPGTHILRCARTPLPFFPCHFRQISPRHQALIMVRTISYPPQKSSLPIRDPRVRTPALSSISQAIQFESEPRPPATLTLCPSFSFCTSFLPLFQIIQSNPCSYPHHTFFLPDTPPALYRPMSPVWDDQFTISRNDDFLSDPAEYARERSAG
jgi:hypothetical protein